MHPHGVFRETRNLFEGIRRVLQERSKNAIFFLIRVHFQSFSLILLNVMGYRAPRGILGSTLSMLGGTCSFFWEYPQSVWENSQRVVGLEGNRNMFREYPQRIWRVLAAFF